MTDAETIRASLPADVIASYSFMRVLPDGRICGVHKLLYHWTMHVGISEQWYDDRYCYRTEAGAREALIAWSGKGDPVGWHRHPASGRRVDETTGAVYYTP